MTDVKTRIELLRQELADARVSLKEQTSKAVAQFQATIVEDLKAGFKPIGSLTLSWKAKDKKTDNLVEKSKTYPSFEGESGMRYVLKSGCELAPVEEVEGKFTFA